MRAALHYTAPLPRGFLAHSGWGCLLGWLSGAGPRSYSGRTDGIVVFDHHVGELRKLVGVMTICHLLCRGCWDCIRRSDFWRPLTLTSHGEVLSVSSPGARNMPNAASNIRPSFNPLNYHLSEPRIMNGSFCVCDSVRPEYDRGPAGPPTTTPKGSPSHCGPEYGRLRPPRLLG